MTRAAPSASARIEGERIRVRADFALLAVCQGLPSRVWDPIEREWMLPLSVPHAMAVVESFGSALSGSEDVRELASRARPTLDADAPRGEVPGGPIPGARTKAWSHQEKAYWFTRGLWGRGLGGSLLALDMGTGKSKVAIDLICSLEIDPVLILAPRPVLPVWRGQFEYHGWGAAVHVAERGTIGERAEVARRFLGDARTPCRVVVANYEVIDGRYPAFVQFAMATPWQLVVCDEVHRIKAAGGKRSLALSRIGNRVPRRLGLTGTPLPHSPMDAYAQFRFLDRRIFGTSMVAYRSRYAVMDGYGGHEIVAWRNLDEFARLMGSIMFQCRADDVLDLPEAIHVDVPVTLESVTLKAYADMERDFVVWVRQGDAVTASNALARLLRLQQIANGYLPDPDPHRGAVRLGTEKRDALAEILEELPDDEPVVVFARFHHDIDAIREACDTRGRRCLEFSGRENELAEWQAGRGGEVLAAQIQAGKEGIDLSRARHAVYFAQTFSLGDYEQSLARIRRPGQRSKTVWYHHVVAMGTVDEKIRRALKEKKDVVQAVLEEARAAWAETRKEGAIDGRERVEPTGRADQAEEEPRGGP